MPAVCRAACADGVSSCRPGRSDQINVSRSGALRRPVIAAGDIAGAAGVDAAQ
jgi:hypothetical protein